MRSRTLAAVALAASLTACGGHSAPPTPINDARAACATWGTLRAGITDTGLRNDAVRRLVGTADTAAAADVRWEPLLVAARQEQAVVTQPNRADPLADVTRYRIARAALDTACDAVP